MSVPVLHGVTHEFPAAALCRVLGVVATLCGLGSTALLVGCQGTTGQEGLPMPSLGVADATVDGALVAEGGAESGVHDGGPDDSGFDVEIEYADGARLLPYEASAAAPAADGGPDGGGPDYLTWPACACDSIDPQSSAERASDAGNCATFVWSSKACDDCIRGKALGTPDPLMYYQTAEFPPGCYYPRDPSAPSALSTAPPEPGHLRYALEAAFFECMRDALSREYVAAGMSASAAMALTFLDPICNPGVSVADCIKEINAGTDGGPCVKAAEAAYETTDPSSIIMNPAYIAGPVVGLAGAHVGDLLSGIMATPVTAGCIPQCFGDAGFPAHN